MNFDWNKFQLMYLLPMDLDETQEFYVERIFGTHQPLATDSLDFDALKRQSNQVGRVLKNRNRRARLENACGLEFVRRWGGGPKAYFAYQRKGINERCSSESSILQEPLQEVDTDNIGGDLLPQSDNSKIQALIESAFKYAENHGEMPIESERGA